MLPDTLRRLEFEKVLERVFDHISSDGARQNSEAEVLRGTRLN